MLNNKRFWLFAIPGVLYLWHSVSLPVHIFYGLPHDDGWFIRGAMDLVDGRWLESYSQMALIKGPVYPIFLAITSVTGVSLQFSTALFHLVAAYILIYALSEYLKSTTAKFTAFILLLIVQFPFQRVIRDEISLCLLLVIISLTILIFFRERGANKNVCSAFLGVVLGLFMLTREDGGITAIPILLLAFSLSLMKFFTKDNYREIMIRATTIIIFVFITNGLYSLSNYVKLKSYVGVELIDSDFNNALSALYSVRENPPQQYVEVTNANILAISKISPTFRSLAAYFKDTGWLEQSCRIEASICGQLGASYFLWALRDAMAEKGYYSTPENAKIHYRKITAEIREACESGKIKCANRYLSKFPSYELFNFRKFLALINSGIKMSQSIHILADHEYSPDTGGSDEVAEALNITHYVAREPKVRVFNISGWYYDKLRPTSWFKATLTNRSIISYGDSPVEKIEPISLVRYSSPDIAAHFHDDAATMQRYNHSVICGSSPCVLKINEEVIGDLLKGIEKQSHTAKGVFYIDSITNESYGNSTLSRQKTSSINRYNKIATLYNQYSNVLFWIGIISGLILILSGVTKKKFDTPVLIIILLWVTFFWRIFFVSLASVFWMPIGLNTLYLYPSIVIMPIASFLSIYIIYDTYRRPLVAKTKQLHNLILYKFRD